MQHEHAGQESFVVGQKHAFATVSLVLALLCFVNAGGMEKAIVAIVFGLQALRTNPPPLLARRRAWAKAGVSVSIVFLALVPLLVWAFLGLDGLREVAEALARLGATK